MNMLNYINFGILCDAIASTEAWAEGFCGGLFLCLFIWFICFLIGEIRGMNASDRNKEIVRELKNIREEIREGVQRIKSNY